LQIGEADIAFSPILFKDPDLTQKHVYDMVLRIYATPEYLSCHSKPKTIKELKNHQLIVYSGENQEKLNIHINGTDNYSVKPYIKVNSGPAMKLALLNHLGIGPYPFDQELIDKGMLIDLFPNMADFRVPYYYSYHKRLENSLRIKVFLDLVNKAIKSRTR
jgi:DNA-binding transcriptional LysR family regulator